SGIAVTQLHAGAGLPTVTAQLRSCACWISAGQQTGHSGVQALSALGNFFVALSIPKPSGVLWRHANFLKLWAAQSVSSFGARITREGLPYAAVLTINASPGQIGILAALAYGPSLIVGMFSGGFVDRSRKRSIL